MPVTLPASNPAGSGALITPATWITASAPSTSRSRLSGWSSAPSIQVTPSRSGLLPAGQGADLMARRQRQLDQPPADEAGAAGNRQLQIGDHSIDSAGTVVLDMFGADPVQQRIEHRFDADPCRRR